MGDSVLVGVVRGGDCVFGVIGLVRMPMCGTERWFTVQGRRLSDVVGAGIWWFGIGRDFAFFVEEIRDERFLLAVESPKVWVVSFGVLSECRDGGAVFPRVGNVVVDAVESSDD